MSVRLMFGIGSNLFSECESRVTTTCPRGDPWSRARGSHSTMRRLALWMGAATQWLRATGSTVCLPCDTLHTGHWAEEWRSWWSTDRVAAGRRRAAGAAAARRAARAGAWSSRAAGRAGPARAWRGRGRRSWVAPSLRCERPPTERVRETLPCERRFFPTVFFAGAGRGCRPMAAGPPRPRRPPPPATLIYVPYIKRVFRVPLWIFLATYVKRARGRSELTSLRNVARLTRFILHKNLLLCSIHFVGGSSFC